MRLMIAVSAMSLLAATAVASSHFLSVQRAPEPTGQIAVPLPRPNAKVPNQTPIQVAGPACGNDGGTCPDGYVCCSNAIFQYWCVRSGESC